MNSPDFLSRFAHALAPPMVDFVCERFFTAPLRALSPVGLLTAIFVSLVVRTLNAEDSIKVHDRNDGRSSNAMRRTKW
jgi:hypothetical protein